MTIRFRSSAKQVEMIEAAFLERLGESESNNRVISFNSSLFVLWLVNGTNFFGEIKGITFPMAIQDQ